jgi:hypothetical protein
MQAPEQTPKDSHFKRNLFFYSTIVITFFWLLTPFAMRCLVSTDKYAELGQVGDMFGAINALFSGITIAGLIITIVRQRDEIQQAEKQYVEQKQIAENHFHDRKNLDAMHHQELKHQAEVIHQEQKKQIQENFNQEKKYLIKQMRTEDYKRFESSFFALLDLHTKVVERIGKDMFKSVAIRLDRIADDHLVSFTGGYRGAPGDRNAAEPVIRDNLSEYFETIDMIVEFIYRRKKSSIARDRYLSTYLTQFSFYERKVLLYYYNLSRKPEHWDVIKLKLFNNFSTVQILPRHRLYLEPLNKSSDA